MKIEITSHEQWVEVRRGKLTASQFKRVMHGKPKGHASLIDELRQAQPMADNDFPATCWGKTHEADARAMFSLVTGLEVIPPPLFYVHDDPVLQPFVGASPDGVVVVDGIECPLEIKCPYDRKIHAAYREAWPEDEYGPQHHGQQWVMNAPLGFFISYDPRWTNGDGLRIGDIAYYKIERDHDYTETLDRKVRTFVEHFTNGTKPRAHDVVTDGVPDLF